MDRTLYFGCYLCQDHQLFQDYKMLKYYDNLLNIKSKTILAIMICWRSEFQTFSTNNAQRRKSKYINDGRFSLISPFFASLLSYVNINSLIRTLRSITDVFRNPVHWSIVGGCLSLLGFCPYEFGFKFETFVLVFEQIHLGDWMRHKCLVN